MCLWPLESASKVLSLYANSAQWECSLTCILIEQRLPLLYKTERVCNGCNRKNGHACIQSCLQQRILRDLCRHKNHRRKSMCIFGKFSRFSFLGGASLGRIVNHRYLLVCDALLAETAHAFADYDESAVLDFLPIRLWRSGIVLCRFDTC